VGSIVVVALLAGADPASAVDGQPPGTDLTVTVGPGSQSTSSPAPPASTPPPRPGSTTTTVNGNTVVNDAQNPPAPTDDERSIGGVLYVSGVRTEYAPAIDPLGGELRAQFTIRNVSTSTIDGSARFWVTGPVGTDISVVDSVDVTGLKPGESRLVEAELPGVGQWTFATAHYTYTPPSTVDGVALEPMTRDAFVFLPPLFLLGLAGLAVIAFLVVRLIRATTAGLPRAVPLDVPDAPVSAA
jgi:hypothetical protein